MSLLYTSHSFLSTPSRYIKTLHHLHHKNHSSYSSPHLSPWYFHHHHHQYSCFNTSHSLSSPSPTLSKLSVHYPHFSCLSLSISKDPQTFPQIIVLFSSLKSCHNRKFILEHLLHTIFFIPCLSFIVCFFLQRLRLWSLPKISGLSFPLKLLTSMHKFVF